MLVGRVGGTSITVHTHTHRPGCASVGELLAAHGLTAVATGSDHPHPAPSVGSFVIRTSVHLYTVTNTVWPRAPHARGGQGS